tara:strand:- start:27074 stop:29344 length:2271 start_codon:yes stop_codon:yes gene_type:complete
MPYNDKEYKVSNVEYLNKDFTDFKNTLMEYAKSYFPDSYKDFNETSPGMMLIEMSAYVGDVLSFYIDQQYKEMMLPLAQERRNVVNIANMLGYKVKPTAAAITTLTVTQEVGVDSSDINDLKPQYGDTMTIAAGMRLSSNSDSKIKFKTLDVVDFSTSGSLDINPEPLNFDSNGIVTSYLITRKVNAISANTKTKKFTVGSPTKFLRLTLEDLDVININSVIDTSTGNEWSEVEYLSQDRVPLDTHYLDDNTRNDAYSYDSTSSDKTSDAVPYSLKYKKTSKKFVVEHNAQGKTSIVFGNGVLRNQETSLSELDVLQTSGIILPGETSNINESIDPLRANDRLTLGEAPFNTVIEISYDVGGGIKSNVASNDLNSIDSYNVINGSDTGKNLTATNSIPARGGSGPQNIEDIRKGAKAYFASQNRCVTKEDYEARTLSLPEKFGSVAKVYCKRTGVDVMGSSVQQTISNLDLDSSGDVDNNDIGQLVQQIQSAISNTDNDWQSDTEHPLNQSITKLSEFYSEYGVLTNNITINDGTLPTIDLHLLTYDINRNLIPILNSETGIIHPLKQNIINYLNNFRMLTDKVNIVDGKVVNFGVAFEVFAHRGSNKSDVKLKCISAISQYFNTNKMFFKDAIHTNDLYYELMDVDGVRSVSFVELTQNFSDLSNGRVINNIESSPKLWDLSFESCPDGDESSADCTKTNTGNYGWKYDFKQFYINGQSGDESEYFVSDGVVLATVEPSVFELKNPNQNIRGVIK